MASSKDNHLTDIISIVQARPKSPTPAEESPVKTPDETKETAAPQEEVSKEPTPQLETPVEPKPEPAVETPQALDVEPQPEITVAEEKPVKKRKSRAGRKPLPDKNRRSEILIIRLTKAEKKKLWQLAKQKHTTLSSFVRKSSIGEYDKE